ncbi:MAG: anthranilate synthase component II [Hyalangium sp.]|uniref:anthranilate synthase component II n=1 Tax=Hyalangium sp. TaxID=2028555 RepID=UPI00389AD5F8
MNPRDSRVIIIDNYDSYAYNLYQAFGELTGNAALVVRNDAITVSQLIAHQPTHLILSPGPGNPEDPAYFGVCRAALLELGARIPVLGVCLGHQGIGAAFGGRIVRAPQAMHGKESPVFHDGSALFTDISSPLVAMRYHSLVIDPATVPAVLKVTARTEDGVIMGVAHKTWPVVGVQFHPESIGTVEGLRLLGNFLRHGATRSSFAESAALVEHPQAERAYA